MFVLYSVTAIKMDVLVVAVFSLKFFCDNTVFLPGPVSLY